MRKGRKALGVLLSAALFALAPGAGCWSALAAGVAASQAGSTQAPVPVPGQVGAMPGISNVPAQLGLPAPALAGSLPSVHQLSPVQPPQAPALQAGLPAPTAPAAALPAPAAARPAVAVPAEKTLPAPVQARPAATAPRVQQAAAALPAKAPAPAAARQTLEAGAASVDKAPTQSGKGAALAAVYSGSAKPEAAADPVAVPKDGGFGAFRPSLSAAAPVEEPGRKAVSIEDSPFIMHTPTAVGYLKAMLQSRVLGHYTMLVGEAGTGKNALIYELSRLLGSKVKVLSLNEQTELRDLVVRTTLKNGETVLAPSALVEAMQGGFEVVLDEVDRAPAGVLAGLNHILQFGEVTLPDGTVVKAKKGFFVWATRNPPKPPYRGEHLSGELEDRFSVMTVDYLPEAEEVQVLAARAGGLPRELVTSLVKAANELRASYRKGLLPRPVTMRSLMRTIDRLKDFPGTPLWDAFKAGYNVSYLDDGLEDVVHKALESLGLIGPAAGKPARKVSPVTDEPRLKLEGHTGGAEAVALSADGRYAFTGSDDNTARMWNLYTGDEVRRFEDKDMSQVWAAAVSPDGKRLYTGGLGSVIREWDTATGELLRRFEGHTDTIESLAVSADGRHLYSASWDGTARKWDLDTGRETLSFTGHKGALKSLLLAPDGKRLFTTGFDGTARMWDTGTAEELRKFEGHEKAVVSAALSPDGKFLFTGSWDKTARMWEVASGKELHKFEGHAKELRSVALSPDGAHLFTGSDDHMVRMWDIAARKFVWTFTGHEGAVKAMAPSADGRRLLTASWDHGVRVWDVPPIDLDAADDLKAQAGLVSNDIAIEGGLLRIGEVRAPTSVSSLGSSPFITHTPTAVGYLKSMLQSRLLGHYTLLVGEAGTGKNALIYELSRLLGSKVKVLSLNEQTELRDLVVRTTLKNGETVLAPSALVEAMQGGFEVVLDEVDRAPAGVLAGLNHILQFGEVTLPDGTVVKAKKGFFVWATRNPPKAPYRGEHLSGELEDRFSVMTVDYLPEAEEVQVLSARAGGLSSDLLLGLVKAANELRTSYRKGLLPRPVTMRSLLRAIDRLKTYPAMPVWDAFKAGYNVSYMEEGLEEVVHKVLDVFIGPVPGRPHELTGAPAEQAVIEGGSLRIGEVSAPTPLQAVGSSSFITHTPTAVGYLKSMLQSRLLGHYTMLVGEAGTGKNALIYELSRLLGSKVKVLSLNEQTELRDLVVRTTLKNGETVLAPSALVEAMEGGFEVVLDEVDRAPAGVLAGLNHILQFGEVTLPDGRVIKAKKGFFVWATRNPPKAPYRGEHLSGELEDRFSVMTVDYLPEAEEVQVLSARAGRVPAGIVEGLVKAANELRSLYRQGLLPRPVTMRSLLRTVDRLKAFPETPFWDAFKAGYNVGYLDEGLDDLIRKVLAKLGLAELSARPVSVTDKEALRFEGHENQVRVVVPSPDGRHLFTASFDHTARMWDTAAGKEVRRFEGHDNSVDSMVLSPDGSRLFTGSLDGTVRMWDTATGKEVRRFEPHQWSIGTIALSPDGRHLFTSTGRLVRMWDTATGKEERAFELEGPGFEVMALAVSRDGSRLFGGGDDDLVRMWDTATGKELRRFEGHSGAITSVAPGPDGKRLFTASRDKTVRTWDIETGKELRRFLGNVESLALSRDGRRLFTAGRDADMTVRMRDAETGAELHRFTGHEHLVWSAALSPDGRRLFTAGSWDKTARMWDVPDLDAAEARDLKSRAGDRVADDISIRDGILRIGDAAMPLAANLEAPPDRRTPASSGVKVPAALLRLLEGLARMLTREPALRMAPWRSMGPGDQRTWRMIFERLELQFLPEDLSDPDPDIPTAMTMHELWHLLETRPEVLEAAHQDRAFRALWNAVEDTRVNELGRARHPGARLWLEKLYRKLYGVRDLEAEKPAMGRVPLHLQFCYGLIYRWWKGVDDPRIVQPKVLAALERAAADLEAAGSAPDALESYRLIRDRVWPVYKELLEEAGKREMDQQLADQAAQEDSSELEPSDKDAQGRPKPLDQLSDEAREKLEKKLQEKLERMTPEQRKELERRAAEEIARQEEKFNEEHGSKLVPKDETEQEKLERLREKVRSDERLDKAGGAAKEALEAKRQEKTGVSAVQEVGFYGYRSKVTAGIATLRAKWQMLFQHKTRKRDMRGRDSGELDEGRLAEAMAGDEAVFRRKLKPGKFSVQVSLLVDLSGSMSTADKYKRAIEGAVMLMESLRDIPGVELEIVGYKAGEPALMLKEFGEPYSLSKAVRVVEKLEKNVGGMNGDHYGLDAALKRIRARPAGRKLVIMSSDGDPDNNVDRKEFARQIQAARDVLVFGLGIGPEARIVQELFPEGRSVWAEDPAQTAEGIFRILDSNKD